MAAAAGASRSEAAEGAGGRGVSPDVAAWFPGLEVEGEDLSGGAAVAVLVRVIAEVLFAEEAEGAVGGGVGLG